MSKLEITLGEEFNPFVGMKKLTPDMNNADVIGISKPFHLRNLDRVYTGSVNINSFGRLGITTSLCEGEDLLLKKRPWIESLGLITVDLHPLRWKDEYIMPDLVLGIKHGDLQFISQSDNRSEYLWFEWFVTKQQIIDTGRNYMPEWSRYNMWYHTLATYTDLPILQDLGFRFEYANEIGTSFIFWGGHPKTTHPTRYQNLS